MSIRGGWAIAKQRKKTAQEYSKQNTLYQHHKQTHASSESSVCVFQTASGHIPPPLKGVRGWTSLSTPENLTHKGWKDEQDCSILENLTREGWEDKQDLSTPENLTHKGCKDELNCSILENLTHEGWEDEQALSTPKNLTHKGCKDK